MSTRSLRPSQIMVYLQDRYCLKISRQTVFNWMTLGIEGDLLKTTQMPTGKRTRVTTEEDLNDFLSRNRVRLPYIDRGSDWVPPTDSPEPEQDGGSLES